MTDWSGAGLKGDPYETSGAAHPCLGDPTRLRRVGDPVHQPARRKGSTFDHRPGDAAVGSSNGSPAVRGHLVGRHLVLSFAVADLLVGMYASSAEKHEAPRWLMQAFAFVVPLIAAMSSNLFILLAVSAATRSRKVVEVIWHYRWPIDFVLALSPWIARAWADRH